MFYSFVTNWRPSIQAKELVRDISIQTTTVSVILISDVEYLLMCTFNFLHILFVFVQISSSF